MQWFETAQGIITMITSLIGLIGTGVGAFFAIRGWVKAMKEKSSKEVWSSIMAMADAAMKQAEESGKSGADKKQMVIDSVKASCKAGGLNVDEFIDQLGAYIDQTITFVNGMKSTESK